MDFKSNKDSLNKLVSKEKGNETGIVMLIEKFVEIGVEPKILCEFIIENDL
ncbi:MAG: hypothetical protein LBD88_02655 [Candidatus Peribacteria bacterium]|nr:hypothetical protein [Candidatus Peribacteria bacterium]